MKNEASIEQEVYRVSDFCKKYAISKTAFYRELAAERLYVIKRGRRTFVPRGEADRWFACLMQSKPEHTYVTH